MAWTSQNWLAARRIIAQMNREELRKRKLARAQFARVKRARRELPARGPLGKIVHAPHVAGVPWPGATIGLFALRRF